MQAIAVADTWMQAVADLNRAGYRVVRVDVTPAPESKGDLYRSYCAEVEPL